MFRGHFASSPLLSIQGGQRPRGREAQPRAGIDCAARSLRGQGPVRTPRPAIRRWREMMAAAGVLPEDARLRRELNVAATERYRWQALAQPRRQNEAQVRAVLARQGCQVGELQQALAAPEELGRSEKRAPLRRCGGRDGLPLRSL